MIKRVIAFLALTLCLCLTAMAQNMQLSIKLDNKKNKTQTENLGYANLKFEYLYPSLNKAIVRVTIENIMSDDSYAILLLKNDCAEDILKKLKPKIEFVKHFPGKKGKREVKGCSDKYGFLDVNPSLGHIIFPAVTDTVFLMEVPFASSKNFLLPLYVAKYKPKDLNKKGAEQIKYQIYEEHRYYVNIEVVGWSEDDPTYVATKKDVENFISSLDTVKFCNNKKHTPSLMGQQRPYQERKDSLIQTIQGILDAHTEWLSTDAPHIAYSQLLSELEEVNLDEMTYDCGEHIVRREHTCGYCSLSAQDISQRLDDLYQQLYAGKISKDQAMRSAKGLYNCYKSNKKRKNDNFYGPKITKFYNGISNY